MKSLLNALFSKLAKLTAPKAMTPEEYSAKHAKNVTKSVNYAPANKAKTIEDSKSIMAERIIEADQIKECVSDVFAQIMAKGYKAIPEILGEYPIEVVQSFVMTQKLALGEYSPELDNLDAMTHEMLVNVASELNQLSYEKRMIEQGKANISAAQKSALERIISARKLTIAMPTNKFDASRLMEKLMGDNNRPKTEFINGITKKQYDKITELCTKLNIEPKYSNTVQEASDYINELMETCTKNGLVSASMISAAQISYIEKLIKMLNKRMTKTLKENVARMTSKEASEYIEKLNEQYKTTPAYLNITEGQVNYIIELCNTLMFPYHVDDIKLMNKEQATTKIDELQREYLAKLIRGTGSRTSKEEIAKMSTDAVRAMIKQIREENHSRDYKNAQER